VFLKHRIKSTLRRESGIQPQIEQLDVSIFLEPPTDKLDAEIIHEVVEILALLLVQYFG